jgi:hypothetical protein
MGRDVEGEKQGIGVGVWGFERDVGLGVGVMGYNRFGLFRSLGKVHEVLMGAELRARDARGERERIGVGVWELEQDAALRLEVRGYILLWWKLLLQLLLRYADERVEGRRSGRRLTHFYRGNGHVELFGVRIVERATTTTNTLNCTLYIPSERGYFLLGKG